MNFGGTAWALLTQTVRLVGVGVAVRGGSPLRHGALLGVAPRPVAAAAGQPPRVRVLDVPSAVAAGAAAFAQPAA